MPAPPQAIADLRDSLQDFEHAAQALRTINPKVLDDTETRRITNALAEADDLCQDMNALIKTLTNARVLNPGVASAIDELNGASTKINGPLATITGDPDTVAALQQLKARASALSGGLAVAVLR